MMYTIYKKYYNTINRPINAAFWANIEKDTMEVSNCLKTIM